MGDIRRSTHTRRMRLSILLCIVVIYISTSEGAPAEDNFHTYINEGLDQSLIEEKRAPMRFGKRAPMRFGKRDYEGPSYINEDNFDYEDQMSNNLDMFALKSGF